MQLPGQPREKCYYCDTRTRLIGPVVEGERVYYRAVCAKHQEQAHRAYLEFAMPRWNAAAKKKQSGKGGSK